MAAPVLERVLEAIGEAESGGNRPVLVIDKSNTLTPSHHEISAESAAALWAVLDTEVTIGIVSGSTFTTLEKEVLSGLWAHAPGPRSRLRDLYVLAENGSELYGYCDTSDAFVSVYRQRIADSEAASAREIIAETMIRFRLAERPQGDQVRDCGSQITFAFLGDETDDALRRSFDPDRRKRSAWAQFMRSRLGDRGVRLDVSIEGTSSINLLLPGVDKAYGVRRLAEHLGIPARTMIYAGDSFGPDRQDTAVARVVGLSINFGDATEQHGIVDAGTSGPTGLGRLLAHLANQRRAGTTSLRERDGLPS